MIFKLGLTLLALCGPPAALIVIADFDEYPSKLSEPMQNFGGCVLLGTILAYVLTMIGWIWNV